MKLNQTQKLVTGYFNQKYISFIIQIVYQEKNIQIYLVTMLPWLGFDLNFVERWLLIPTLQDASQWNQGPDRGVFPGKST